MQISLVDVVGIYVCRLFDELMEPDLYYHNLDHTLAVVKHAHEIATHYNLNEEQHYVLGVAAWFHDTGHLLGKISHHEQASINLMKEYLSAKNISADTQDAIARCIMATKMPVNPSGLLEEILCDADTWHLGTSDFERIDQLVWKEFEVRMQEKINDRNARSLQFMQQHRFYTSYCRGLLNEGKERNIELLRKKRQNIPPGRN